jgi:hypothetical protein
MAIRNAKHYSHDMKVQPGIGNHSRTFSKQQLFPDSYGCRQEAKLTARAVMTGMP